MTTRTVHERFHDLFTHNKEAGFMPSEIKELIRHNSTVYQQANQAFIDANENKDTPLETLQTLGNKLIDTQESQLNLVILVVALALRAKGFE
jgi:hypothetical protein